MIQENQTRKVHPLLGIGIFLLPLFTVWVLLREGYSNTARAIGFGWLLFVALLAYSGSITPPSNNVVASKTNSPAEAEAPAHRRITAGEFNDLPTGETYEFIAGFFGPGELQASSDLGGTKTESYVWSNPDGSNMSLMFQNDRMIMKAQYGLQ